MNYPNFHYFLYCFLILYGCRLKSLGLETTLQPFCYLCDSSPRLTINASDHIREASFKTEIVNDAARYGCYESGVYTEFCQPLSRHLPHGCVSYISILPPATNTTRCKVEILSNNGSLKETLVVERNGIARSTYNIWNITQYKPLRYNVNRILSSNIMARHGKMSPF